MTNVDIKIELMKLGKKQSNVVAELEKRGFHLSATELCKSLSDYKPEEKKTRKERELKAATLGLIEEWKQLQAQGA